MNAKILLLGSIGLLAACLSGPAVSQAPAAEAPPDCNTTPEPGHPSSVTIRAAQPFTVCLPENAGTAYSWQIQPSDDAKAFDTASVPVFDPKASRPGMRGWRRFTLRTTTTGRHSLTFLLKAVTGEIHQPSTVELRIEVP